MHFGPTFVKYYIYCRCFRNHNQMSCSSFSRFQEKRQSLLERLFLNPRPEARRDVMQVLVQEKGREGVLRPTPQQPTPKPVATGMSQTTTSEQLQDSVLISVGGGVEVDSETV